MAIQREKTLRLCEGLSIRGTIRVVLADGVHRWRTLRLEKRQVNTATIPIKHGITTPRSTRLSYFGLFTGLMILVSLASTGCQMDIAGQTLPSAYYLSDDVQYYAPGPEFKLAREAAALKEQSANQISERQR